MSTCDKTTGDESSESDGEKKNDTKKPSIKEQVKAFKGIDMDDFSKLVIPKSVMQDGILFIWVEKEYIMEVANFLEEQDFYYVENMCWVMLDETMKDGKK